MSVENKFKLSLLGLEKKILDLEGMVSDLSEKVKKIDLKDFQKKLEEFEDLVMVSNLALMDLKGKVEAIEKGKLTSEEFEKLVNEIKPDVIAKLDKDIKKVESELDSLKEEMQPKKISEIRERIGLIENKISQNPVIHDLEVLDSFLEIAKSQNWASPKEIEEIQENYKKIKEEILQKIARESLNSRQEKILQILKERGKIQIWQLKEFFPQVSKRTLRRDLLKLISLGHVLRTGQGPETFYQIENG